MFNTKDLIFEGLAYTVMGLVVVFMMLIIIMFVIKAMELFSREKPAESEAVTVPEEAATASAAPINTASDDCELVAVITAAVAAAMGKSQSELVIRSYKKLSGNTWNTAGRREILDNRF